MNVEPSPSADSTRDLAPVVARRRGGRWRGRGRCRRSRGCGPGRPGRSARRCARGRGAGCRCRGRRTATSTQRPSVRARTCTLGARVGVLHRVVEQVVIADTSWRRSPHHREPRRRRLDLDRDAPLLGRRPDPVGGLGDDEVHRHVVAPRLLVGLDPGQLEQVVDGAADPERLGEHALGQPPGDRGVVLVEERLGQQGRARRPGS